MTVTPRELVFTAPVFRVRHGRRIVLSETPAPAPPPRARPLKVARLIALAHRLEARIEAGETAADVARALGFTRARITQLLGLTLLAPDIQERLLFMTNEAGHDRLTERALRAVVAHMCWADQRLAFGRLAAAMLAPQPVCPCRQTSVRLESDARPADCSR